MKVYSLALCVTEISTHALVLVFIFSQFMSGPCIE